MGHRKPCESGYRAPAPDELRQGFIPAQQMFLRFAVAPFSCLLIILIPTTPIIRITLVIKALEQIHAFAHPSRPFLRSLDIIIDIIIDQPFPDASLIAASLKDEPAFPLVRKIEKHVLETAKRLTPVERALQVVAQQT